MLLTLRVFFWVFLHHVTIPYQYDDSGEIDENIGDKLSFVYYRNNWDTNETIWVLNATDLFKLFGFDKRKITVFFAAGFTNTLDSRLSKAIIGGYLHQQSKYNIIQINYTYYSLQPILKAFPIVPQLGKIIGLKIEELIKNGLKPDRIHLCGLSLGAQLVGNIARQIKVGLLIGLDPAGPGFYTAIPRFKRGLAKFTIEVHSDVGVYGTPYMNGDLTILLHDGHRWQPGCPTDSIPYTFTDSDVCSHNRAMFMWGWCLRKPELFIACKCYYLGFCRLWCNNKNLIRVGPETRARGTYYLETTYEPPYGLGMKGLENATKNNPDSKFCHSLRSQLLPTHNETIVAEDLYYIYYRHSFDNNFTVWLPNAAKLFTLPEFDLNKTTMVFVSGYTDTPESEASIAIVSSYAKLSNNYNVLELNYSAFGAGSFLVAFGTASLVGEALANSLSHLFTLGLPPSKVELVGFSLGAQVLATTVKKTSKPVGTVVGLDPAGPLFYSLFPNLVAGYATFTLIVHTDAKFYGMGYLSGDANYLPNDGHRYQPGCSKSDIVSTCSHSRVAYMWGAALLEPDLFIGVSCNYTRDLVRVQCNMNDSVVMTQSRKHGDFYFKTGARVPYGLGVMGIEDANLNNTIN